MGTPTWETGGPPTPLRVGPPRPEGGWGDAELSVVLKPARRGALRGADPGGARELSAVLTAGSRRGGLGGQAEAGGRWDAGVLGVRGQ